MKQLTLGQIMDFVWLLKKGGMHDNEVRSLPVYLGDDDELNGIHCGWYANLVDVNNPEDSDLVEMINEDRCNIKLDGKAILISWEMY